MRPLHQFGYSQASVANEKDGPSQLEVPSATGSTKSSTDGVPNTTPQDLSNEYSILRQGHIDDTETRSSGLSDDNILRLEELSDARPQVGLSNDVVGLIRDGEGIRGNGDLLCNVPELGQLGRQVWEESLETDSGILRVQNPRMIGMELVREARSVVNCM